MFYLVTLRNINQKNSIPWSCCILISNNYPVKKIFVLSGFIISSILIIIILTHIDWFLFFTTIQQLQPFWLLFSALFIISGVLIRSLRWNLIAINNIKLKPFWDAANLGYLGNLIYPARAGEILRIVALRKFIPIAEGPAISSAGIDRLADGIMIPFFLVIIIEYFGRSADIPDPVRIFSLFFICILIFVGFFIIWGKKFEDKVITGFSWLPPQWVDKLCLWYIHAHESASSLKNPRRLSSVLLLSILSFLLDSLAYYALFLAFGWSLPFSAALIMCIFIFAGSTLPSTPGYFGIYQIACILALRPFGISDTASVAYSLVLQCTVYAIFLIIGGWIMYTRKISFNLLK